MNELRTISFTVADIAVYRTDRMLRKHLKERKTI